MFSITRPFYSYVVSLLLGLVLTGVELTNFVYCFTGFSFNGFFSWGLTDCLTAFSFEADVSGFIVPSTKAMNILPDVKASLSNSESINTAYLYPTTYSSLTSG
jgi:hypothetical protein